MINRHNPKYLGGSPNLPAAQGDRFFSQDLLRDQRWMLWKIGELYRDVFVGRSNTDNFISNGLEVSQGTGHTIDITAGVAIVKYDVDVIDNSVSWANPPAITNETISVPVIIPTDLTDQAILSANTDGVTTNYVKLKFLEDDTTTQTRAREKKAGSYNFEVKDFYQITVDDTAPTYDEVKLVEFTTNGTTITFTEDSSAQRINISLEQGHLFFRGKNEVSLTVYEDGTTEPQIKVGSVFDCKNKIIEVVGSDKSISGWSGISALDQRVYIKFNNSTLGFEFTDTDPTWSDQYQGWYSGNDRYLYAMFKFSTSRYSSLQKMKHVSDPIYTKVVDIGPWNMRVASGGSTSLSVSDYDVPEQYIVDITATVREDTGNGERRSFYNRDDTDGLTRIRTQSNSMLLSRSDDFESLDFDSTSFNRGWVLIKYRLNL